MSQITNYDDVVKRVRDLQSGQRKDANLASQVPEKDPNETGTVTVPKGVGEDPTPQNLPPNRKPEDGDPNNLNVPGSKIEGAGPTGTAVPSTVDGKPKEEAATTPTVSLEKIASITANIRALQAGAAAPATAAAPAPATPVKSAAAAPAAAPAADTGFLPDGFSTDMMLKLASSMLATEEGRQVAEAVLLKSAGAEAAANLLSAAKGQFDALVKHATAVEEWNKSAAAQEAAEAQAAEELLKNASVEERAQIVKFAKVHPPILATINDPMLKQAYQQGVMDAAAMDESMAPPAEGGAPGEPSIPGAEEGPPSIEQIAMMLQAAVEAGEIPPEAAEQIMQQLAGAAGGAGPEGGAPAGPEGALPPGAAPAGPEGGMPMEALPEEAPEEAKAASLMVAKLLGTAAK